MQTTHAIHAQHNTRRDRHTPTDQVVLSCAIVTKTGKALVARQFVEMTRIRIEGLLAAFPKLVGSGGKQHTYVETENVRYVYHPMEGLYLMLVTNKQSNIVEDLETLRLLSKVVPEYVPSVDEDNVGRAAFELIFAFDEVISLGQREPVNVTQVKQYTEMESHEEKLHKMIIQSKINDTKDVMKRKALEIDKSKVDKMRDRALKGDFGPSVGGGPGGGLGGSRYDMDMGFDSRPPMGGGDDDMGMGMGMGMGGGARGGGGGGGGGRGGLSLGGPKKGLVLGAKGGASTASNQFLDALRSEGEMVEEKEASRGRYGADQGAGAQAAAPPPSDPIVLTLEEKVVAAIMKDGGIEQLEVQGTISLEVNDEASAMCRIAVSQGDNPGFQFKTHPNIDKQLYASSSELGLKDPNRPFPSGSPLGILKWRMASKDEDLLPISINCWPSVSGGETYVNIEYEANNDMELQNLAIEIPLPASSGRETPTVNSCDGDYRVDTRRGVLMWTVDLIDNSNRSGSMEVVVPNCTDPDAFFPIDVTFSSQNLMCDISVDQVFRVNDGSPVRYAKRNALIVDSYQVA